MTTQITANNIAAHTITVTQLVSGVLSPKIQTVSICDSSYNVLDDTAANTDGGYIQITGSTFGANSQVIIGTNNATSVTFVNTSTIRAQVPAASATSYPVYVIDADTGATAIKINGLTHSSFPAWSTGSSLSNQAANTSFGVSLSASSDSNITYTNTSALPDGTTLAANGYFSGTVSIGSQTTYSFGIKATDSENQDTTRTFSLTVTVTPQTRLYVWGSGDQGQLGLNDRINKSSPTQVGALTTWNNISAAKGNYMAATKTDGTLWMWGQNNQGQTGQNDTTYRSSPTQVGALTTWNLVSTHNYQTLATKTDGTLWTWGNNTYGTLGLNDVVFRSSPVQIGAGTTWSLITTGSYFGAGIKTNGTLWTWGRNFSGEVGNNNVNNVSSPIQVGALTNWSKIANGLYSTLAVKTDGTLWAWGFNSFGQLGLNNAGNYLHKSSPTQVGTNTNWSDVACGNGAWSCAIKTDGTLWTWGYGNDGLLGLNSTSHRSSPTQVGVSNDWSIIKTGNRYMTAIKTNGTLWTWGSNFYGQLGQNDSAYRSSPVQVGVSTNWTKVVSGYSFAIAVTSS